MSKTENALVHELFKDLGATRKSTRQELKKITKPDSGFKKHTFKLDENVWSDFKVLAQIEDKEYNTYINELISSVVEANAELIAQIKKKRK